MYEIAIYDGKYCIKLVGRMVVNNGNDFSAGQRRSCYFMMSYHPHVATPHLRAHERDIPFKFLPQDQWTRSKYTYPSFPGRTCNAFLAYFF